MKSLFQVTISILLVLSLSIVPCFALPILTGNEVDFTARVVTSNTVDVCANFSYTNQQIDEINNGHSLGQLGVYTLDFSAEPASTRMGYSGDYYTNFPNPYPDADDDDGNGYSEEFEVAIQGRLATGRAYVLRAEYVKDSSVISGGFNLNEQYSIPITIGGDHYNTVPGTSHAIAYASLSGNRSTCAFNEIRQKMIGSESEIPVKYLLKESVTSIEDLNKVVHDNERAYQNMCAKAPRSQEVTSVVTFNGPIAMSSLKSLLIESGAALCHYQAKFINAAGDWCTYGSNTLIEKDLIDKANEAATLAGSPHTSYEGIVCAELRFPTNTSAYDVLKNSDFVYFADMSLAILENDNQSCILPSYAWELDSLRGN